MDTADKVVLEVEGVNAVLVYLGTRPWSEVNALIVGLQQNSQLLSETSKQYRCEESEAKGC